MATRSSAAIPRRKIAPRHWLVHFIPGAAAIVCFWIALLVLDPRQPFTLSHGTVLNSPVRPGDVVTVDWVQSWSRRCHAESVRSIVRADRKVDTYETAAIRVPDSVGERHATGEASLSKLAPPGPAIYRSKITFPAQVSLSCILPWSVSFTTPDVPFMVSKAE